MQRAVDKHVTAVPATVPAVLAETVQAGVASLIETQVQQAIEHAHARQRSLVVDLSEQPAGAAPSSAPPSPLYQPAIDARLAELTKMPSSDEKRTAVRIERERQRIEARLISAAHAADLELSEAMAAMDAFIHECERSESTDPLALPKKKKNRAAQAERVRRELQPSREEDDVSS